MHDDDALGIRFAECCDVFGAEPLMNGAMSLPKKESGIFHFGFGQAAVLAARIPDPHVVEGVSEIDGGIAAQMLIGEEKNLFAASSVLRTVAERERPFENGARVG